MFNYQQSLKLITDAIKNKNNQVNVELDEVLKKSDALVSEEAKTKYLSIVALKVDLASAIYKLSPDINISWVDMSAKELLALKQDLEYKTYSAS